MKPPGSATVKTTICHLYGLPEQVVTDNGPQFSSGEFSSFLKEYWGETHT